MTSCCATQTLFRPLLRERSSKTAMANDPLAATFRSDIDEHALRQSISRAVDISAEKHLMFAIIAAQPNQNFA